MKKNLVLTAIIMSLAASLPASAEHGPPAQIINDKASPACVSVKASYLPLMTGIVNAKGAAIALTNNCEDAITVHAFATSKSQEAPKTEIAKSAAQLVVIEGDVARYSLFRFNKDGAECAFPLPAGADGKTKCRNLVIPPRGTLSLHVPWGSFYSLQGKAGDEDMSAEGAMINPRNPAQAINWYLAAAEKGDAQAQYQLGFLYGMPGETQDAQAAMKWLERAAAQGNMNATTKLAFAYQEGLIAMPDPKRAYFWWCRVAPHAWDGLYHMREAAGRRLTDAQKAEQEQAAAAFKPVPEAH
ncbi:MAG: sel1 repeat family protein [Alphaproteobacteria bacterium]|nr:MAG: sel1 repeat family protein [Alphaproteobacteria bacterium]